MNFRIYAMNVVKETLDRPVFFPTISSFYFSLGDPRYFFVKHIYNFEFIIGNKIPFISKLYCSIIYRMADHRKIYIISKFEMRCLFL